MPDDTPPTDAAESDPQSAVHKPEPPDSAVIEACIRRMAETVGRALAVGRARSVDGLTVADDGEVLELGDDGETVLSDLVDSYADLGGDLVPTIVAGVVVEQFDVRTLVLPERVAEEIDRAI